MVVVEKRLAIGLTEGPWPGPLKYHKRSGEVSSRDAVGAAHTKGTRKLVQAEHRHRVSSQIERRARVNEQGSREVVSTSRRSMYEVAASMDAGERERVGSIGAS